MPLTVISVGESGKGKQETLLSSGGSRHGEKIEHMDMTLTSGPEEGCISVDIGGGCDANGILVAMLDQVHAGVDLEVRTVATGEFGVCVGLLTMEEYEEITAKRKRDDSDDDDKPGGGLPTDRTVSFALSENKRSEFSCLQSTMICSRSQARLRVTDVEGRTVLTCEDKTIGSVPLGARWFVAGEGHDGDFGDPMIVLRLEQEKETAAGAAAVAEAEEQDSKVDAEAELQGAEAEAASEGFVQAIKRPKQ